MSTKNRYALLIVVVLASTLYWKTRMTVTVNGAQFHKEAEAWLGTK
tara:strand:+ start:221 stop:358 length:138 start_codon:yes stop_codon:yes gene_type:complete